jgi:hypothetical protein
MKRRGILNRPWVLLLAFVVACADVHLLPAQQSSACTGIVLSDVTPDTGVTFCHTDGGSGRRYIVEYVSAGLALFDYNGDGLIDIYLLNGAAMRGTHYKTPPKNVLYRNDGGWRFTDVTDQAGVGDTGHGLGVVVGDYDNDGDPDLYLNNFGPNVLYRNRGDGTFEDVTIKAGVANGDRVGAGVCFLDYDADGYLDLYVSNYLKFSFDLHVPQTDQGVPVYPSPLMYQPDPDTLYRNRGDGTFEDVSAECGIAQFAGTGMGMVCLDYDDDGDTDVIVGNDAMQNYLFENDGSGRFEEAGLLAGLAFDLAGIPQGTMGVECGDYDNDGGLDIFTTSYQAQPPVLYRYAGDKFFEDVTVVAGVGTRALPNVNWGIGMVDFDNDGDRDLFMACGHLQDNISQIDDTASYGVPNILLQNAGNGSFRDVSADSGSGMSAAYSSRGAGFDDLDNDGDVDAVILNARALPTLMRNDTRNRSRWLEVELTGRSSNRDGVGARVIVTAADLVQVAEVHSGRSYQSHFGSRLHFGLASNDRVDRIEIRWPSKTVDVIENVAVDQLVSVIEAGETGPGRDSR